MVEFLGKILNFMIRKWWFAIISLALFCLFMNILTFVESDSWATALLIIALISLFPIAFFIVYGVVIYPIKQLIKLLKK